MQGDDGRWHNMKTTTWAEIRKHLSNPKSSASLLLAEYMDRICIQCKLPSGCMGSKQQVLKLLAKVAKQRRIAAVSMRWMSSVDGSAAMQRRRHMQLFLTDATIIASNGNPFGLDVPQDAPLDSLFDMLGHTLQVGGALLRNDQFWNIEEIRCTMLADFRRMHGDRIRMSTDPESVESSGDLALKIHCAYACNSWVKDIVLVVVNSNPGLEVLRQWGVVQGSGRTVDPLLLSKLERLRRSFAAQWSHTMVLWQGGVYRTAAFLNASRVAETLDYFELVTIGTLWLEDVMADTNDDFSEDAELPHCRDPELLAFRQLQVWPHSQLYREVIGSGIQHGFVWVS